MACALGMLALGACVNDLTPRGRWSQPVLHDGYIYVGNTHGSVVRLDAETHAWDANWIYPFKFDDNRKESVGGRSIYGAPTVVDGILYLNNYHCTGNVCNATAFAASIESGDLVWPTGNYDLKTKLIGGQVVTSDGFTVFGTTAIDRERDPPGYLYGLEANPDSPGRFAFKVALDGEVLGDVAYDADANVVYVGTDQGSLYAIDVAREDRYATAAQDRILWSFAADGAIAGPVVFANGHVYFGDLSGRAYKLDPGRRATAWTYEADAWVWAHPLVDVETGKTYVSTLGGHVTALDDRTGGVIWDQVVEGQIVAAPALYVREIAGSERQVLAVPSGDEGVHVLNAADGSDLGMVPTGSGVKSSPTLIGDKLYVHNLDDELRWYSVANQSLLGCVKLEDGTGCG